VSACPSLAAAESVRLPTPQSFLLNASLLPTPAAQAGAHGRTALRATPSRALRRARTVATERFGGPRQPGRASSDFSLRTASPSVLLGEWRGARLHHEPHSRIPLRAAVTEPPLQVRPLQALSMRALGWQAAARWGAAEAALVQVVDMRACAERPRDAPRRARPSAVAGQRLPPPLASQPWAARGPLGAIQPAQPA